MSVLRQGKIRKAMRDERMWLQGRKYEGNNRLDGDFPSLTRNVGRTRKKVCNPGNQLGQAKPDAGTSPITLKKYYITNVSMSSSLRNSLHRRNHKERSQLAHRSRLGILEKHKDYVKRARDFHSKQERIKRLKEKAAERNKDEFYFGMVKSQTTVGCSYYHSSNMVLIAFREVCTQRTEGIRRSQ